MTTVLFETGQNPSILTLQEKAVTLLLFSPREMDGPHQIAKEN